MKIQVTIFSPNKKGMRNEPEKFEYNGNYAIETMIIKTAEKYFGKKISDKIEYLLRTRIGEE
jgi:hypothetical protein